MTTPIVSERQSPAFSFYPADFLVGTATFSLEERGAYITLLSYQWDLGSIPDAGAERARLLNCSLKRAEGLWDRMRAKFDQGADGAWRNARLETERAKQGERRAALAANGTKGADRRWHSKPIAPPLARPIAPPMAPDSRGRGSQTDGLSSSSSSSTPDLQRAVDPGTALTRVTPMHPARRHGLQTLHRSGHHTHAFCSERICVPEFQHDKFVRALGGVGADERLRALYVETVNGLPDEQSIESDPLKFWPPIVAARWPPKDASVGTRTAALQRATAEFLRGGN